MLTLESQLTVPGLTGAEITEFFRTCTDERYQAWWPGVHLHLHQLATGGSDHVGDVWLMDELIGTRHVRMGLKVVAFEPGRKIVWQFKKGIRLPVRLALELTDLDDGVAIRHTMTAGWDGPGRLLDPLWRLYNFSPHFVTMLDQHVRTEFPRMRDLLHPGPTK